MHFLSTVEALANALKRLELGALPHGIGKIGTPSHILAKPGLLNDEERAVIELHPELGERILPPIVRLEEVRPIVRHCHERRHLHPKSRGETARSRLRNEGRLALA